MQTRLESFIEVWINVGIGFWINFAANYFILPLFGFNVSLGQTFWIGVAFTAISVGRSYIIRRWAQASLRTAIKSLAKKVQTMKNFTAAFLIASALFSVDPITRRRASSEDMADALYFTIDAMKDITDEKKADLYATLAEKLTPTIKFSTATRIIQNAL